MNAKTCKNCTHHKAVLVDLYIDDDGKERPVFEHKCDGKPIKVLDFACGLWQERGL